MTTLGQANQFTQGLQMLEKVFTLRSYLVGHSFSLADVAVYAALRGEHSMLWHLVTMVTSREATLDESCLPKTQSLVFFNWR